MTARPVALQGQGPVDAATGPAIGRPVQGSAHRRGRPRRWQRPARPLPARPRAVPRPRRKRRDDAEQDMQQDQGAHGIRLPSVRRTSGRASPCAARGRTTGSSTSRRPALAATKVTEEVACGPISIATPWLPMVKPWVRSSMSSRLVTITVTSSPSFTVKLLQGEGRRLRRTCRPAPCCRRGSPCPASRPG